MFPAQSGLPHESIISILQDFEKILWVRTTAHLFVETQARLTLFLSFPSSPRQEWLSRSRSWGNLMIPTVEGLHRRVSGHWEVIDQSRGMALPTPPLRSLKIARRSLDRPRRSRHPTMDRPQDLVGWTQAEGLPDNVVWSNFAMTTPWLATSNGVAMWIEQVVRGERLESARRPQWLRRTRFGLDGAVWVLCYPGGLTRSTRRNPFNLKRSSPALTRPASKWS